MNKYIGLILMTPAIFIICGVISAIFLHTGREDENYDKMLGVLSVILTIAIWGIIIFFDLLK